MPATKNFDNAMLRIAAQQAALEVVLLEEKGDGVAESLPLTGDLAWLLGVFCAEGAITTHPDRPNSAHLSFCLGPHEEELIARTAQSLANVFQARPMIVARRTTTTVEIGQTSIARFFESLCGRGARNEQVPIVIGIGSLCKFCTLAS